MTNTRVAIVVSVLTIVGLFGLGEGSARALEGRLSSAGEWPDGPVAEQFNTVLNAEHGPSVSVVFAGSSMVEAGVDASRFASLTGLRSLNVALPASTNFMVEPWLVHVVVPMLRPRIVAIGVASRDFNDNGNGPADALQAVTQAPGYRSVVARGTLARIDRVVSRYSALVRLRRELRRPTNVLRALSGGKPSSVPAPCASGRPRYAYHPSSLVSAYPTTVLKRYSAGGTQTRALIKAVRELQRLGTKVVLVKLPTTSDYLSLHPHGHRDIVAFDAALRDVVGETNASLIDASALHNKSFFRDQIHLNCAGAERLTMAITREWPSSLRKG